MSEAGRTPPPTESLARQARIVVVSPHPDSRQLVQWLDERDYELCYLEEFEEFDDVVARWNPDVVAVDETCTELNEGQWIRRARLEAQAICILLVERYETSSLMHAVEAGAEAFLPRQVTGHEFVRIVERELGAVEDSTASKPQIEPPPIVGDSPQMRELCRQVAVAAPSDATVLVTGESGTGKELVARAIHRFSPRRTRPFVAINCGAIPHNLVESELFGHLQGAFTGASADRHGHFRRADGGTLFLDEIGELSTSVQVKLLRVLESRCLVPLGSSDPVDIDVRLVAATNAALRRAVESGRFRADLYYRLHVLHIKLPPLRQREDDIRSLWEHFVRLFAADEERLGVETDPAVFRWLERHDWPGNVRELGNAARYSVTMRDQHITPGCLPAYLTDELGDERPSRDSAPEGVEDVRIPGMSLEELERIAILRTVESAETIKEAADILGISERTLYYRLEKYRED